MDEDVSVLVTAAGSASGINVIYGLRVQDDLKIKIVGVDSNPLSAGLYLSDIHYVAPPIQNLDEYLKFIINISRMENINVILPIYSKEILIYAMYRDIFLDENINLLIPEADVVRICDDKYEFYKFIKDLNILTPETYLVNDFLKMNMDDKYYFLKPRKGSGSKNTYLIKHKNKIKNNFSQSEYEKYLVQEYIAGKEYTVDFLADKKSNLIGALIRERIEVRDGKTIKARSVYNKNIIRLLSKIVKNMRFVGPGNLQGIMDKEGNFYVTELNPRFAAGGLPLTIAMGFNIPLCVVKLLLGMKINTFFEYPNDVYMIRYFTQIFLKKEGESYVEVSKLYE